MSVEAWNTAGLETNYLGLSLFPWMTTRCPSLCMTSHPSNSQVKALKYINRPLESVSLQAKLENVIRWHLKSSVVLASLLRLAYLLYQLMYLGDVLTSASASVILGNRLCVPGPWPLIFGSDWIIFSSLWGQQCTLCGYWEWAEDREPPTASYPVTAFISALRCSMTLSTLNSTKAAGWRRWPILA